MMLNSLAYSQYRASEYLWSLSDEVLLVKVLQEEPELWRSITTCTSDVTVGVLTIYKSQRIAQDVKQLTFARLFDCSTTPNANDAPMLKKDKQYIIFLSSENLGEVEHAGEAKKKVYALVDLVLGIQEYSNELEGFLKSKQREKR